MKDAVEMGELWIGFIEIKNIDFHQSLLKHGMTQIFWYLMVSE